MRFLIDAQLPPALARRLNEAGHEASHVGDRLPGDASDREVAALAEALGATLMSKDADFWQMHASGRLRAPFIWVRSGNLGTDRLWAVIRPVLADAVKAIEAGEMLVEIR